MSAKITSLSTAQINKKLAYIEALAISALNNAGGGGTASFATLTGEPDDNTALTTYIGEQVAALVGAAPSTLDTLDELAAALGDDANYATTITTALGTKAPINSPTFTGTLVTANNLKLAATNYPYLEFGGAFTSYIQSGINDTLGGVGNYMAIQVPVSRGFLVTQNSASKIRVETNGTIGFTGNTTVTGTFTVTSTTEQLRLAYDASNYFTTTVASNGITTFASNSNTFIFTGNLTASTGLFTNGALATNTTSSNANFNVASASGASSTPLTQVLFSGATNVGFRIIERGSSPYTMGVGHSHGSHIIGEHAVTEAASGTHAMLSQLVVKPLVVTDGTATTTDAATVYITGTMTGVTPTGRNDALRVDGVTYLNGATENAGSLTIGGTTFVGFLQSNSVSTNANLTVWASTAQSSTQSQLLFGGAAGVTARVWERGSSSPTIAANNAYASHIIGTQNVNEASSGTHPFVAQLVVNGLTMTNGAGATAEAATVYITGVLANVTPTGRNDALRVDGPTYLNGLLTLGNVPEYADNAAATGAGLINGNVYRTGDALKIVHA